MDNFVAGGTQPGKLTERWPKDADGMPEKAVFLTRCSAHDLTDELTVNMLEAYDIPCLRTYPGDGAFGKVVLGMSGLGVDIMVPESLHDEAAALIEGEVAEDEEL